MPVYAIKAEITEPGALDFCFINQKTMYGGKQIAAGDTVYLFASENEGGLGLLASALVVQATPTPATPGLERQTPRVSISVRRTALARQPLGRLELKAHAGAPDHPAQAELHFKFYRQATNKIVAITEPTADFIAGHFMPGQAQAVLRPPR